MIKIENYRIWNDNKIPIEDYINWGKHHHSYSIYQSIYHFREETGGWNLQGYFF